MTPIIAQSIDWRTPLTNALEGVMSFVPRLVAFLVILLVARLIAGAVRKVLVAVLARAKFDNVMDRAGVGAPLARAGFADSGRFIGQIAFFGLMLIGLQLAISVFGPNPVGDLITSVVAFIPSAIVAMIIIIVTGMLVRAINSMLEPFYANMDWGRIARGVVTGAIWMIGVFAALDQVNVAQQIVATLFTTVMGSLGLILVIQFGVGGIWSARDRFWPAVYDRVSGTSADVDLTDEPASAMPAEEAHTTV